MVELNSVAGRALVAVSSGSLAAPTSDAARASARLFLHDVTQTLRWHAVVATVALAATPVVYQLARVVAHRNRAELVNVAKSAVQREELFNGSEADGVMIDPAEEGGITISYNTLSAHARRQQQHREGGSVISNHNDNNSGGGDAASAPASTSSSSASTPTSALALRVGRRHSWIVSSFAHQVLAAQRAPNVQFVRTCSRAAACQYGIVVLRACATSCVLCVAAYTLTHACCSALDRLVPLVGGSGGAALTGDTALSVRSLAENFVAAPVFETAAPPSASVGCCYGLYDFSVSASGVWSRLVPRLGVLQTWDQRLTGRLQPLHEEWRDTATSLSSSSSSSTPSAANARADTVWSALTPRGYFLVTLLPRLPWRILSGVQWAGARLSESVLRRWYGSTSATTPAASSSGHHASASTTTTPPPQPSPSSANSKCAGTATASSTHAKTHTKLIHKPLVKVASLLASDVAFAGLVYVTTLYVSRGSGSGGGPHALVHNAAGARYNAYCWVEAICSVLSLAVL